MNFAILVNRNGLRIVRWPALCLFLAGATLVQFLSAAVVSLVLVGDLRLAWFCLPVAFAITGGLVFRILKLPLDQLPSEA